MYLVLRALYLVSEQSTKYQELSTIIADCFDRTTTHSFLTQLSFFLSLWLFEDKRVVLLVTPREVVGCSIAANIAIDA